MNCTFTKHNPDTVRFKYAHDFGGLAQNAFAATSTMPKLYSRLLRLLWECENAGFGPHHSQQECGTTYEQRAATGHKVGMSMEERTRRYPIAESVTLSCRHAGHMLSKLKWGTA